MATKAPLEVFYRLDAEGRALSAMALRDGLPAEAPVDWAHRPSLDRVRGEIRVTLDRKGK